jgi:hypothetical protein
VSSLASKTKGGQHNENNSSWEDVIPGTRHHQPASHADSWVHWKKKPNSRYMTKEMGWVNSVLSYHYSSNIPPAPFQNKIKTKKSAKKKFPGLVVKNAWVVFWLQLSSLPDSFLFFVVVVSSWATYDCLTDFLTGDIIACNCCE